VSTPVAPESLEVAELRRWLEELVRQLAFAKLIAAIVALVVRLREKNTELVRQVAHLTRKRPRSEKLRRLEAQLELPWKNESTDDAKDKGASPNAEGALPETKGEKPSGKKPKRNRKGIHPGRKSFPSHLERVPLYNPVEPDLRVCDKCGMEMGRLGHTSCEYIDVIPAKVVVVRRTDETLKCNLDGTIVSAKPPPRIVERGVLGNRLIIEATADKFVEHQPIERQSLRYARSGVEIAPQTLGRGVATHLDLMAPLAEAIRDKTRGPGYLATDATGIPVLDRDAPEGIRHGTMWSWTNALWVSFFYSPNGDSDSVREFLGDGNYNRTIQADGTSILNFIERAGGKRPGCWAHARRGLVKCARSGNRLAHEGVLLIAPLFEVEKAAKQAGDNAASRKERRLAKSKDIVDKIRAWVDEQRAVALPKSDFGKALGYIHRQWSRLTLFLEDGNVPLTNNRRERELRKLVLGRRNWLFTWEDLGGERTANILTIVGSAVSFGLNPREYLVVVTQALLEGKGVEELLPHVIAETHPELRDPSFEPPPLPD